MAARTYTIHRKRVVTKNGQVKYKAHIKASNGEICDTPGQLYKYRSSRARWIREKVKEYKAAGKRIVVA